MKKALLLLIPLMLISFSHAFSQKAAKPCKLTVKWTFEGIIEGYDHDNKMVLFVDGEEIGETTVMKESEANSYTFLVARGEHDIKLVNYAFYEGEWEEHTVANEYSLDCIFEEKMEMKKKCVIELTFDIEAEETRSTVKHK